MANLERRTTQGGMIEPLTNMLKIIYLATYPHDGYDPITNKQNGKHSTSDNYIFHPITIITSLLGLPNRDLDEVNEQSISNIAKNIIGWEDDVGLARMLFNIAKVIPVTAWNLSIAVIRLTTNIAKLFTEFLPGLVAIYAKYLAYNIYKAIPENKQDQSLVTSLGQTAIKGILWTLYLGIELIHYTADIAFILGRAITSPHKSVRVGWRRGLEMAGDNWLGRLIGCALAIASIAITVIIYAIILPIAAKYLVALIVPHLPAAAMLIINHTVAMTFPILSKIGSTILMPIVKPVFHALGITVSPAIVTISALAGTAITTIGTVTSKLIEDFKNWWFNCGKRKDSMSSPPLIRQCQGSSAKLAAAMPRKTQPQRQIAASTQQASSQGISKKTEKSPLTNNKSSLYGASGHTSSESRSRSETPFTRRML